MVSGVVGVECWYRYNRLERRLSSEVVTRLSLLQCRGVCGWTQEALCRKDRYVHVHRVRCLVGQRWSVWCPVVDVGD